MQPQSAQDYQNLLTEVIKKQIVILGPDITLSKARNVKGLTVLDDGTVTEVTGSPQEVTQALIDQFVQLSGLIVKKTMEPLLLGTASPAPSPVQTPPAVPPTGVPPVQTPPAAAPVVQEPTAHPQLSPQPLQSPTTPVEPAPPALPVAPETPQQAQPAQPPAETPKPATNPLAA